MTLKNLYGAIEAGGSKFVCALGTGPADIKETRFATTSPEATLQQALSFFEPYKGDLKALGIASFGPIDLHRESSTWGCITTTPKPGWANTNMVAPFECLGVPIGFDTDVNAAALGEGRWGAATGLRDYVYYTIGTGIGGGAVVNGELMHGLVHTEMGHGLLPKIAGDNYKGKCPYHFDRCFEGLASGPAIEERWQTPGAELAQDHPAWQLEADYIAMALASISCTLSPEKIILGGGVMTQLHLFAKVRAQLQHCLNGYIQHPAIEQNIKDYIVPPKLGQQSGILGALVLAEKALGHL